MDTVEHFTQTYRCWEAPTKFTKIYPRRSKKYIEFLWKIFIDVATLDGHKDPAAHSRPPGCLSVIVFGGTVCKPAWKARPKRWGNQTKVCGKKQMISG
jgi:hypothetical protein